MREVTFEIILSWLAVASYALAIIALAWGVFFTKERGLSASRFLVFWGIALHGLALALRWYYVGHGPYTTAYEVYSSNAWVILAIYGLVTLRMGRLLPVGLVVLPGALFFLLLGLSKYDGQPGLPTAFHYFWLVIHVLFIKLSIAAILVALGCSLWLLRRSSTQLDSNSLELYNYRFMGLAFVFWTIATASGAVWANLRWGRYWSWDPIETWSLIVWLGLGLDLHLQRFFGWRGRRAAWLTVICFSFFILALFVVPFISQGLHTMYVIGGSS
ncbi:cytochrome c biogenesis protein CcsA [Thermosulfuriphilus ammonigenes]|uniref:Cytochrome c biogenesis protein CcsA n=1 Tax=Thermosulfuriphilus ammonigenes TaxID=1936021 RepID=A0A6G7PVN6_9BACT|nr:cytochrome c biogenesis protein CcsA [Thermosulfuriphilus ammonigenes]MBA2848098.1 ABC-type transport system involved in cytochrome c biogenesis permease subunit [Thermosulfuriphilus ammonigenes]QIJ71722.1 cytochrome c biogenesis protein CcsA [Thermosulfuriphilus ammonigenes]